AMLALAKASVSATQSIEQSLKSGNRASLITSMKHKQPVRDGKRHAPYRFRRQTLIGAPPALWFWMLA
ncbi:MAG: hypothetical protein B7Z20_10675, partial [Sphingobium sp. 32-64-5]